MARRVKGRSVGGLFRGLSGLGGGARGLVLVLLVEACVIDEENLRSS